MTLSCPIGETATLTERIMACASSDLTIPQIARAAGASYQHTYRIVTDCDLPCRASERGRPAARSAGARG